MTWLMVQLRRLADARAATAGLMILALVTAMLAAATPRLIDRQADQAMRATVEAAQADTRNIALIQSGRIPRGAPPNPLAVVDAAGSGFADELPSGITALVGSRYTMVETPRFRPMGLEARTVRLRALQDATSHMKLVAGSFPTGNTGTYPVPAGKLSAGTDRFNRSIPVPTSLTVFEIAISSASARDLNVDIGATLVLFTDQTDKLAGWSTDYVAIKVVGIYDVTDPSADYWFADGSLTVPQIRSLSSLNQIDDITVLMSPDAYPALLNATTFSQLQLRYTWRLQVDPNRLTAAGAPALVSDLRRMNSVFLGDTSAGLPFVPGRPQTLPETGPVSLQSGLFQLVTSYTGSWRSVLQVLAVVAMGSATVALLGLALICVMAGRRREASFAVWRNRGASGRRLTLAALVEVLVELAIPGTAGLGLAVVLIPSSQLPAALATAAAMIGVAGVLLLANALSGDAGAATSRAPGGGNRRPGTARRNGSRGERTGLLGAVTRGAGPRRLVLEGFAIALAVLGAYVLQQRGVGSAGVGATLASAGSGVAGTATGELTGPDPFVAAVPALIGVATALIVMRLLPLPLALIARIAERGRGLVPSLAFQRATRRPGGGALLAALLSMAAVWAFAWVSLSYLDRAADAASWQTVGASYRVVVREATLTSDWDPSKLPDLQAFAPAAQVTGNVPEFNAPVGVLALDLAAYRNVVLGGGLDGVVPDAIDGSADAKTLAGLPTIGTSSATGTPADPIPALVSSAIAAESHWQTGSTFELAIASARPTFKVVEVQNAFPTFAAGSSFMVVSRSELAAAIPAGQLPATEVFLRAPVSADATIRAAIATRLPGEVDVTDQAGWLDATRGTPEYTAVVFGLAAASVVAAVYGALAILAALWLTGAEQALEAAHLRVLGLSGRQSLGVSALEHGPAALFVTVVGVALGVGLFLFLRPSLGLGSLVGGEIDIGLPVRPEQVALLLVAIGAIVALAIAIETATQARINAISALRRGIE